MLESVFIRLFAGVPSDYFEAIPLIPFGQWLLPIVFFSVDSGFLCRTEQKVGNIFLVPLWNRFGLVEKIFCEKGNIWYKDGSIDPAHCFDLRYCYGEIDFTFCRASCKNQCLVAVS